MNAIEKNNHGKSNVLLHILIKQELTNEFKLKNIKPGSPFPSVRQLTKRFNTTIATIDKAIKELKKDGIVYSYPRKGAFWGKKKNFINYKTIGIHVPVLGEISPENSPYFYSMIEAFRRCLDDKGFCVKLLRSEILDSENELRNLYCDGVICTGAKITVLDAVDKFKKLNLPYLLLDRPLEDDSLNYLERDSQENISDMVKFLVDKKYKSIGLVGLESELWIFEKIYKGYIKAMEEVKCPLGIFKFKKNELSYFNEPDHNDFLDFCKRHSAIIIGDPHAGLIDYIVAFLTQNKISIPEKCAVLSLTNKNELISYGIPVSSFSITPQEMGTKAGEGIIRILESEDTVPLNIKFKTEIKWKY